MKQGLLDWTITIGLVLVVISIIGLFDNGPNIPAEAPHFIVNDINGHTVDLQQLRGQTVVINFWATWCGSCIKEIPDFSRFAKEHPDIPVIGLAVDSGTRNDVSRFANQHDMTYTVAIADPSTVDDYDIGAFPTTIIVDPAGQVQAVNVGAMSHRQLSKLTQSRSPR